MRLPTLLKNTAVTLPPHSFLMAFDSKCAASHGKSTVGRNRLGLCVSSLLIGRTVGYSYNTQRFHGHLEVFHRTFFAFSISCTLPELTSQSSTMTWSRSRVLA